MESLDYFKALQNAGNGKGKKQVRINQAKFNLRRQLDSEAEDCLIDDINRRCVFYPNKNDKTIFKIEALPDDDELKVGSVVEWSNNFWLITNVFLNSPIQSKGEMTRCNQLLRFQNFDGQEASCWCCVEDPINARQGNYVNKILNAIGTLHVILPENDNTKQFFVDKRFILWTEYSSDGSVIPATYKTVEIRKRSDDFSQSGLIHLTLQRDTYRSNDSIEKMIADYTTPAEVSQSYCEIQGRPTIRMGGLKRTLIGLFYEDEEHKAQGIVDTSAIPSWTVNAVGFNVQYEVQDNTLCLWITANEESLIGKEVTVTLQDERGIYTPINKVLEVV